MMTQFFGLTYTGFAFDSITNDIGQQLLKCHVEICHDDTEDSMCKTGCFEEPTTEVDQPDQSDQSDDQQPEHLCGPVEGRFCKHTNECDFYNREAHPDTDLYTGVENYDTAYYEMYIDAGDNIKVSRLCTSEWERMGDIFVGENALGCDDFAFLCNSGSMFSSVYKAILANEAYITQRLSWQGGAYTTFLNCPQCSGCTEGEYDAPTFDEIACLAGPLSPDELSGNYPQWMVFPKEDDPKFGQKFR